MVPTICFFVGILIGVGLTISLLFFGRWFAEYDDITHGRLR